MYWVILASNYISMPIILDEILSRPELGKSILGTKDKAIVEKARRYLNDEFTKTPFKEKARLLNDSIYDKVPVLDGVVNVSFKDVINILQKKFLLQATQTIPVQPAPKQPVITIKQDILNTLEKEKNHLATIEADLKNARRGIIKNPKDKSLQDKEKELEEIIKALDNKVIALEMELETMQNVAKPENNSLNDIKPLNVAQVQNTKIQQDNFSRGWHNELSKNIPIPTFTNQQTSQNIKQDTANPPPKDISKKQK